MGSQSDHPVFDRGILSYFLICFCVLGAIGAGGMCSSIAAKFIGIDADALTGILTVVISVVLALAFKLYFRKEGYKGILNGNKFFWCFLVMLPFLAVHYTGSIVSWAQFGRANSVIVPLLSVLTPGFGEEMTFRGLGVANFMRNAKSGKDIKLIFWISSVVFGLMHLTNISAGADVAASVIQSVYAIGVGMLFCAVYLRSGNLWPLMIAHASVDFMEFMRGDLQASGGTMTGLGVGDWITIGASGVAVVIALILINKKHEEEIIALWNKKWGH